MPRADEAAPASTPMLIEASLVTFLVPRATCEAYSVSDKLARESDPATLQVRQPARLRVFASRSLSRCVSVRAAGMQGCYAVAQGAGSRTKTTT